MCVGTDLWHKQEWSGIECTGGSGIDTVLIRLGFEGAIVCGLERCQLSNCVEL